LQRADIRRDKEEILCGGGEYMPGIPVQKGHEEIETDDGGERRDQVVEEVVPEFEAGVGFGELVDYDVDACIRIIRHNHGVHNHTSTVQLPCSLRSISYTQDKWCADEEDVSVAQDHEDVPLN
jgi:hypothetical protein